ncbi:MAG: electron transfer flavoprotein subunit beta/FixA family protein [Candidatus Promineifilaceae bacterium]|nr:electron transfer flavoprotein subunit beta/FixA family protein [Candidatus Promineifilaceae bacterium]
MKIVACIKYSLDVSEVKVDPASKELKMAGVPYKVGHIDKNVLETAVQLQEAYGGTVHAVTVGPSKAKESFREAMAMGLEDVTLIENPVEGQVAPAVTAKILAETIKKMGDVDIIVCGEVSDDGFTYQVPPRLADALEIPQVSFVRSVAIEDGKIVADRDLEDSVQTVSAPLPVLISVMEEINTPRRPTLLEAMKAKKKPVHIWNVESDLGFSEDELLQEAGLEKIQSQGVVIHRKQQVLKGENLTALSNELVDILFADQVLEGGS